MNIKNILLVTSAISVLPFVASAESGNWYVGVGAGAAHHHDADIVRGGTRNDADFDWGWSGETALGYRYGNGFRTELELSYKGNNDVDTISGTLTPGGDTRSWAGMINVLYDIDMFEDTRFMPYIGLGAGVIRSEYDNVGPCCGFATRVDDTDTTFGYQGIAGISFRATEMVDLYANYKYTSAHEPEYNALAVTNVDADYDVSTIMAGIRINLGAPSSPAPAPVAAAAEPAPSPEPETSRTYLVFFDFNRSDLTPEALDVLRQAAEDARNGGAVKVEVRGHADRSGSDAYNVRLSQKRAQAVRSELGRLGLPVEEIATQALGEREPLVPTADGVKEPQNRRAEIVYVR